MPLRRLFGWFKTVFGKKNIIKLGLYGPPNAGKTTLANKISMDWTGEPVGKVSEIPHETREVQKKERIVVRAGGKKLIMNLLDMPGIATKVDFEEFMEYGLTTEAAQQRAKEATKGVIGNLEARDIPIILVANKLDLSDANPDAIRDAFPQHHVVEVSALTGKLVDELYEEIAKYAK